MKTFFKITTCGLSIISIVLLALVILTVLKCNWASRECVENISYIHTKTETFLYSVAFIISLLITSISFILFWILKRKAKLKLK
jgi:uncharacterized BrkB/YihY/UPF0761 family membrane protein